MTRKKAFHRRDSETQRRILLAASASLRFNERRVSDISECLCYNLTMRTRIASNGQMARSFIDMARRAQIIGAAIETISSVGYGHASLARIADRVGISKGVISYHFAGKDELIREVVAEVYAMANAFIRPRVEAEVAADTRKLTSLEAFKQAVSAETPAGGGRGENLRAFAEGRRQALLASPAIQELARP